MEHLPVAREVMRRPRCIISPDLGIYEAMEALKSQHAAAAMVCEQGHLVGILTEKDCLRVISVNIYEGEGVLGGGTVRDYMSAVSKVLQPEMDLFAISTVFLSAHFVELPVLDGEELVGCVSRRSMLEAILRVQREFVERRMLNREWQRIVLENPETKQAIKLMVTHQPPQMAMHV